jgi:LmbE family N-acetylglucosaminyl deacetylase
MRRLRRAGEERALSGVLVVAPHPDDEVIGCGGAVLRHAELGRDVTVVTLGERVRSVIEKDVTDEEYEAESRNAHRTLRISRHIALGLPGRRVTGSTGLIEPLVRVIRSVRPEILYVPHADDGDRDHREAHEAALEAAWLAHAPYFEEYGAPAPAISTVFGYEVWTPILKAQYIEGIDEYVETKVAAMRCYRSQLRHAAWDEAILALARFRGVTTGVARYAEAFGVLQLSAANALQAESIQGRSE